MSNWITQLNTDLKQEFAGKPVVATLATVRLTPSAAEADARSTVVRRISDEGELLIVSDSRSCKNAQLKTNPSATAVFWLPSLRKQFRISGLVGILSENDDARRLKAWHDLSDSSRALFHWPAPGEARKSGEEFPKAVRNTSEVPAAFEVLLLNPQMVEVLDLNPHPHSRQRWIREKDEWHSASINP